MTETTSGEAQPRALLISAQSADKLAELCREAARSPFRYGLRRQTDARETLGKYRRAAVASGEAEAAEILLAPPETHGAPKKLAFAFPGQGAAGAVPVAELRRILPTFSKYLGIAEKAAERAAGVSLSRILEKGRGVSALEEHISVFAYGAALAFQYIGWGFRPDFILPHSLGEYAALAVSGMAELAETAQFVCRRALVIDSIKERGVMLHAEAALDFAEELASRHAAELSVAAVNGARSVVLSGTAEAARRAERALDAAKIPHRRLRVPYAAHSPLASQIAEKIAALPFPALNEPSCPVFSSIDGNPLTAAEVSRPPRRAEQCLRPARFDKALASARNLAQGAQITAVEFGVHRTLAGAGLAALPQSRWLGASSMKNYVAGKSREYCFKRGIMETAAALWEEGFANGAEWTKI
ncbi:acyltransferase domain-containing protein [uncultured Cloacibacillus sp.]|uniref:acyltransferase domain-containing protein n=1 Tax=uncultured Cloacibacillus sp. TaxID=889794 RepID=UPI003208985F